MNGQSVHTAIVCRERGTFDAVAEARTFDARNRARAVAEDGGADRAVVRKSSGVRLYARPVHRWGATGQAPSLNTEAPSVFGGLLDFDYPRYFAPVARSSATLAMARW